MFTFAVSSSRSRIEAIDWVAKASLISITSRSWAPIPARLSALRDEKMGPKPMVSGLHPDTAILAMRAIGLSPLALAYSKEQTSVAAAPSVSGEAVPAVTVPFSSNASFSPASPSRSVVGRRQPSASMVFPFTSMGTISSDRRPFAWASPALR